VGKRQTRLATFDAFKQANQNHILGPGVFGLVGLGSMIEEMSTTEDLFALYCFSPIWTKVGFKRC